MRRIDGTWPPPDVLKAIRAHARGRPYTHRVLTPKEARSLRLSKLVEIGTVDTQVLVRRGRRVLVLEPEELGPDDEVVPRSDPLFRKKGRQRAVVEAWKGLRILVCGGRDYADRDRLNAELDRLRAERGFSLVTTGGARGADTLAAEWAGSRGVPCDVYMADWAGLGRKAGPIRNERMLHEGKPELVVGFPGGRGTAHMYRIAREAGVEVIEIPGA